MEKSKPAGFWQTSIYYGFRQAEPDLLNVPSDFEQVPIGIYVVDGFEIVVVSSNVHV